MSRESPWKPTLKGFYPLEPVAVGFSMCVATVLIKISKPFFAQHIKPKTK